MPFALVFNTIGIWHSLRFATGCVNYFVVSNLIFVVTFLSHSLQVNSRLFALVAELLWWYSEVFFFHW